MSIFSQLLAKNCPKLHSLSLEIRGDFIFLKQEFFEHLQQISTLKTLEIKIRTNEKTISLDPLSSLQSIKYLTHLRLMNRNITDDYFANIHLYCPQLESIELKTLEILSDKTLYYLEKLKQLKRITIFGKPWTLNKITDSGICSLITNCKQLNKIVFNCGIRISYKTIEALKQIANRSPKRRILFKYCWIRREEQTNCFIDRRNRMNAMFAEEFWSILNGLPNNLRIFSRDFSASH